MSDGEFIALICVSDGIVDTNWFKKAIELLEQDDQVSHAWGLPQSMYEDGRLGEVFNADFFEYPPPQKKDFLPYWLATGEAEECNAVFRRPIFETYYPKNTPTEVYRFVSGPDLTIISIPVVIFHIFCQ